MKTLQIVIKGLVQGIGYRPFVAKLAEKMQIQGTVRNTSGIVTVEAQGEDSVVDHFVSQLRTQAPPGAKVASLHCITIENKSFNGFTIETSTTEQDGQEELYIASDIATCDTCLKEFIDPTNRRFGHPFISCTSCGPRYSIIKKLPYDRESITMAEFDMCPNCKEEYATKGNRRRHAQTIACPNCGPKVKFSKEQAIAILKEGGILATKDIGGFHLVCSPFDEVAIEKLREIKNRERKPFAVMFASVEQAREYCNLNKMEEELLQDSARPIVLVERKEYEQLQLVCTTSSSVGAMLPCNPMQTILVEACGPLVMTSANLAGDQMEINNESMERWMQAQLGDWERPSGVWSHNREIVDGIDDSIVRVIAGRTQILRRARGFVPMPFEADVKAGIFATGGDLKAAFSYTQDGRIYVSRHFGDLEEESCIRAYQKEKARMKNLFGFKSQESVTDLHPGYVVSSMEEGATKVQHHKAHVASVIAEHFLKGAVLGFAFDGTGYGEDGTVWGSEVFLWKNQKMERITSLPAVKLIGGNEGAKNTKTIAYGFYHAVGKTVEKPEFELVSKAIEKGINTVTSTSMGRLFDAVSYSLGICEYNHYEGEAACELEYLASTTTECYPLSLSYDTLWEELEIALKQGVSKAAIARGFLYAVADWIEAVCDSQKETKQVVLSGGTFLNRILTEEIIRRLEAKGYEVYLNEKVPCGDGGLCVGQAYLMSHMEGEK